MPHETQIPSVLVLGATGGVGRAVAGAFGRQGWDLILAGRNRRLLEEVTADTGGEALLVHPGADGAFDFAAVEPHLRGRSGRLGVLVLCAGQWAHGPVLESTAGSYQRLFEANVEVQRHALTSLGVVLRESASTVIAISSTQATATSADGGAYSASMHAARALYEAFRLETRHDGVRLMRVELGRTATPMAEAVARARSETYAPDHLVQPDDVARVVLALASLPPSATVTELTLLPA